MFQRIDAGQARFASNESYKVIIYWQTRFRSVDSTQQSAEQARWLQLTDWVYETSLQLNRSYGGDLAFFHFFHRTSSRAIQRPITAFFPQVGRKVYERKKSKAESSARTSIELVTDRAKKQIHYKSYREAAWTEFFLWHILQIGEREPKIGQNRTRICQHTDKQEFARDS